DSKIANLYFTSELSRKLKEKGTDTKVISAHPGWTATDLQRHNSAADFLNRFFAQKVDMGALPTLYAAVGEDAESGDFFGPSGFMEIKGYPKKVLPNKLSSDENTAKKLWEVSEYLTGIKYKI
ncbi:MAG: short-chain dehydrogenase, partial [Candidatus Aminicenantes bacterium]|nr:short-chain dehydrogenase [Candidatus Aminicenantes bacterium]